MTRRKRVKKHTEINALSRFDLLIKLKAREILSVFRGPQPTRLGKESRGTIRSLWKRAIYADCSRVQTLPYVRIHLRIAQTRSALYTV